MMHTAPFSCHLRELVLALQSCACRAERVTALPGDAACATATVVRFPSQDADGPCYATAGRVELLPLAKLVQKLPAVTINGKAVVSPSCRSRFMQCTGAVADAFLKAVHSKVRTTFPSLPP